MDKRSPNDIFPTHFDMSAKDFQERAQNAPLWGPSVEDQRGGDVVAYSHHLGVARQEVQYSVAQGGVETQGLELDDELGGQYGVKCRAVVDEQHSHIGIPLVQMG
jgi:hypothetical protein